VTRDPIGYEGSPWNLYEYVGSTPTSLLDSSGLAMSGRITCCGKQYYKAGKNMGCCGCKPYVRGEKCFSKTWQLEECPPPYNECRDDTVDFIACMDCCMKGGIARRVVVGTVGFRKVKVISSSEVSTKSIWKKQFNWIGTKCGGYLDVSKSLARKTVSRTVVAVTIVEGGYTWTKLLTCAQTCAGK